MKKIICGTPENRGREEVLAKCKALAASGRGSRFMYVLPNSHLLRALGEDFMFSPEIGGIVYDSFVLFEGLCKMLADRLRLRKKQIGDVGRLIAIKNALSRLQGLNQLEVFHSLTTSQGFLQDMLELISAFKRANIRVMDLKHAFSKEDLTPRDREVLTIYEAYEKELESVKAIDQDDLPMLVLDGLLNSQEPQEALKDIDLIVFDGFFDFTPVEKALIHELSKYIENVFICFDVDMHRRELFGAVISLAKSFEGFSVEYYEGKNEQSQTALEHVKRHIFAGRSERVKRDESVCVSAYPTIYREVREAARIAKELIQSGKYSTEDICFVVRDMHMYRQAFVQVFREFGLPTNLMSYQRLSQTCIGRAVESMLAVACDWSYRDVIKLLKSGYIDLGESADADIFEQIILKAGVRQSRKSWDETLDKFVFGLKASYGLAMSEVEQDELKKMREEILRIENACDSLKNFLRALDGFGSTGTLAHFASVLLNSFEKFGFEKAIVEHLSNPDSALGRFELEGFIRIKELLNEIRTADRLFQLPGLSIAEFRDTVKQLLQEISLCGDFLPDEGIRVFSATELRLLEYPIVFLLGLGEGIFPTAIREDWIYPDEERVRLTFSGINLDTAKERRQRERLFFYAVISCAKERLYISYPEKGASDNGLPSQYLDELLSLFDDYKVGAEESKSLIPCNLDGFNSQNELLLSLVTSFWSSGKEEELEADKALALYGFAALKNPELVTRISYIIDIEAERDGFAFSNWDGYITDEFMINELRDKLTGKVFSITELEAYAQCPFMYFAGRVLKLKEQVPEEDELTNLDRGEIYHEILKEFFEVNRGRLLSRKDAAMHQETLQAIVDKVFSDVEARSPLLHKAFLDIEKRVMFRELWQLVEHEMALNESADVPLYPTYFEVGFGLGATRHGRDRVNLKQPLIVENEDEAVRLWGKIDRIDLDESGRFLIYDYKKSKAHSFADILEGRALQIAVYIMAADKLLFGGKKECLGGAYYTINTLDKNVGLWKKEYSDITGISLRTKSSLEDSDFEQIMENVRNYILEYVSRMKNGEFVVKPSGDCPPFCEFKRICRYDKWRIQKKKVSGS